MTRSPALLVALAVVAAGAGFGAEPSAAPSGAAEQAPASAPRLGVVSFNMQHRDRPAELKALADGLRGEIGFLPDFILCQEVLFRRPRSRGQENTAEVLGDLLGYHCHGTARRSDREGVAILSRHPFAYWSQLDLEARTSPLLLGFRRVCVMGEFLVSGSGRVRVVNVHFAYWPFEHQVRRAQLRETLEWIEARQEVVPADVTILGGDFNIQPGWGEMELLSDPMPGALLRFQDRNTANPTRGRRGSPSVRVDYIFVAAAGLDVHLLSERLLFPEGLPRPGSRNPRRFWPSDHVPLLHEYALRPREAEAVPLAGR